jgi:hypothetical protein
LETSVVTVAGSSARTLSSHMLLPRRPSLPVLRNSRGARIRLDRLRKHVAIPARCEPPLPSARRALGLNVDPRGVVGKFSQLVTHQSLKAATKSISVRHFPPTWARADSWRCRRARAWRKSRTSFLGRLIPEACAPVQDNLEAAVEFLLRLRRPGALSGGPLAPA